MEGLAVDDHAPVITDIVAGRNLVVLVSDVALEATEIDVAGDVVTSLRICVGHKEDMEVGSVPSTPTLLIGPKPFSQTNNVPKPAWVVSNSATPNSPPIGFKAAATWVSR